jgi:hypothetical protein
MKIEDPRPLIANKQGLDPELFPVRLECPLLAGGRQWIQTDYLYQLPTPKIRHLEVPHGQSLVSGVRHGRSFVQNLAYLGHIQTVK